MPLQMSISNKGTVALITLRGTMIGPTDRDVLQAKIQEVLEGGQTNLILDMGEVNYADSTGIGGLLGASNLITRKGGSVRLLHLTKRIHDVLQITRLSTVFGIYDDLQKALDSFESLG